MNTNKIKLVAFVLAAINLTGCASGYFETERTLRQDKEKNILTLDIDRGGIDKIELICDVKKEKTYMIAFSPAEQWLLFLDKMPYSFSRPFDNSKLEYGDKYYKGKAQSVKSNGTISPPLSKAGEYFFSGTGKKKIKTRWTNALNDNYYTVQNPELYDEFLQSCRDRVAEKKRREIAQRKKEIKEQEEEQARKEAEAKKYFATAKGKAEYKRKIDFCDLKMHQYTNANDAGYVKKVELTEPNIKQANYKCLGVAIDQDYLTGVKYYTDFELRLDLDRKTAFIDDEQRYTK